MKIDAESQALWGEYRRTGSHDALNDLVEQYIPLIEVAANRVSAHMPRHFERDDLVSYGTFGLIEAIKKFDLSRHVGFERYAMPRINGSIYDELRMIDWVPRSMRDRAKAVARAGDRLAAELGRMPTTSELAAELGVGEDDLDRILKEVSSRALVSIDQHHSSASSEGRGAATLADLLPDRGQLPGDALEVEETRKLLSGAINRLARRERFVLTLYYYEKQTLTQIAGLLGVTESRVSQIRSKGVDQLRAGVSSSLRDAA